MQHILDGYLAQARKLLKQELAALPDPVPEDNTTQGADDVIA